MSKRTKIVKLSDLISGEPVWPSGEPLTAEELDTDVECYHAPDVGYHGDWHVADHPVLGELPDEEFAPDWPAPMRTEE